MRDTIVHTASSLAVALCSLACTTPAAAAEPANTATTAFSPDIVVTANKRSEKIQAVPIQVDAFSGAQLANANVHTTQDVLQLLPNVTMDHSFTFLNSFVVIRGISEINNADSPLSIVVDGVPQNNQKQALMDLYDVQQVEVLRGPQGSLYGRNAIGGAMIITTQTPTNTLGGFGQVSYGNGDAFNASAGLSGALIPDKLLFRVSGNFRSDGGRIENTYLGEKVDKVKYDDGIRGRLLFLPSPDLTFDARVSYGKFKGGATWDSAVFSGNANDIENPSSDILGQTTGYVFDATLKIEGTLPFGTLTSITGFTKLNEDYRGSLDFTNPVNNPAGLFGLYGPVGQGQDLNDRNISEELRLTSHAGQPLRWVAGLFYVHEDRSLDTHGWVNSPLSSFGTPAFYNPPQAVLNSYAGYDDPAQTIVDHAESDRNDAYAAFGQADYDLSSSLTATAGMRYDSSTRRQTDELAGTARSVTFGMAQPKFTLTYHVNPAALIYATVSTGFRSGGWNGPGSPVGEFGAEHVLNYEAGFKTQWFDKKLTLNGDYFYAVDHNFQFFYVQASCGCQVISNLPSVHLSGVELELEAHPVAGLSLFGSLGTTHSTIANGGALYAADNGNKTAKTMPFKINAGIQYQATIAAGWEGLARIDFEHKDKEYWQIDNLNIQRPLNLLNARLSVSHGGYEIALWGRNLTNTQYYEDYNPKAWTGLPYDIGSRAEPRTYGVEVRAKF